MSRATASEKAQAAIASQQAFESLHLAQAVFSTYMAGMGSKRADVIAAFRGVLDETQMNDLVAFLDAHQKVTSMLRTTMTKRLSEKKAADLDFIKAHADQLDGKHFKFDRAGYGKVTVELDGLDSLYRPRSSTGLCGIVRVRPNGYSSEPWPFHVEGDRMRVDTRERY